jgi:hypothetical protein
MVWQGYCTAELYVDRVSSTSYAQQTCCANMQRQNKTCERLKHWHLAVVMSFRQCLPHKVVRMYMPTRVQ